MDVLPSFAAPILIEGRGSTAAPQAKCLDRIGIEARKAVVPRAVDLLYCARSSSLILLAIPFPLVVRCLRCLSLTVHIAAAFSSNLTCCLVQRHSRRQAINMLRLFLSATSLFVLSASAMPQSPPFSTSSDGATIHTVNVGKGNFRFDPNETYAEPGDIITFNFYPTNHSVVRAAYGLPCIPYEDTGNNLTGFSSGNFPVNNLADVRDPRSGM